MKIDKSFPGPAYSGCKVSFILNHFFERYTAEEINEILIQTLHLAVTNPDQKITKTELADCIHAINLISETFTRLEKNVNSCISKQF